MTKGVDLINGIKAFSKKSPVLASLIITAACILILCIPIKGIYTSISGGSDYPQMAKYLLGALQRYFGFAVCLVFIVKIGYGKALSFNTSAGWKVIMLIWPAIIICITASPIDLVLLGQYKMDGSLLVPMILNLTGVGLFEEIFFRGAILSILLAAWGSTQKGIYKAVIVSSIMFGLLHLLNLINMINGDDILIETIAQIIYATFLGILFAAIYLRTKNIWIAIIIHAAIDIANDFYRIQPTIGQADAVSSNVSTLTSTIVDNLLNVLMILPLALFGLFILRKVKSEDIEILN